MTNLICTDENNKKPYDKKSYPYISKLIHVKFKTFEQNSTKPEVFINLASVKVSNHNQVDVIVSFLTILTFSGHR